ncbi:4a-hydroxytetrahydrobiopterin dehydratase [Pseudarthrobacter enclensis]|uniref:4a-hydroxytetrahydrobiopterin dehydratase n=1 Tax=Pseudarthrobacter enclensis TaxID=993070 RepID=UPI0027D7D03D|nr:4a-hydroxytetrahydrobiopterin dehydratase [Pseudarthrobacter enclensis]
MIPQRKLSAAELAEAGLIGWRLTGETLTATFRTRKISTGLELVNRIGASAEEANHHPNLTLTYPKQASRCQATMSAGSPSATSTWPAPSAATPRPSGPPPRSKSAQSGRGKGSSSR